MAEQTDHLRVRTLVGLLVGSTAVDWDSRKADLMVESSVVLKAA